MDISGIHRENSLIRAGSIVNRRAAKKKYCSRSLKNPRSQFERKYDDLTFGNTNAQLFDFCLGFDFQSYFFCSSILWMFKKSSRMLHIKRRWAMNMDENVQSQAEHKVKQMDRPEKRRNDEKSIRKKQNFMMWVCVFQYFEIDDHRWKKNEPAEI